MIGGGAQVAVWLTATGAAGAGGAGTGGAGVGGADSGGVTLVAVLVRGSGVERVIEARMRAGAGTDADAVGAWLKNELEGAGMWSAAKRGVVMAVGRGEVAIKRVAVPPGASEAELPGMVRLQMTRQLPTGGGDAAIDFVPMEGVSSGSGSGGMAVLAAALPGERLRWRERVASAAGLKVSRIALAAEGAAEAVREATAGRSGGVLGVVLGAGTTELVVVEHGQLVFARAIEVTRPSGQDAAGDESACAAMLVEARRTWMSYRVAAESAEIEEVVVLSAGRDAFAEMCAKKLGDGLEMPGRVAGMPAGVNGPEGAAGGGAGASAAAVALVGLLGQEEGAGLDFASPRKPVNRAERRRRVVLLTVLAGILGVGGVYTWGRGEITTREDENERLRNEWTNTRQKHWAYLRDRARVEYLERYLAAKPDWVSHLNFVHVQLPDGKQARLEELTARFEGRVAFEMAKENGKKFELGKWKPVGLVTIELAGSSRGRQVADDLRERFQNDSTYALETRGADVQDHFDYVLTTQMLAAPEVAAPALGAAGEPAAPGGASVETKDEPKVGGAKEKPKPVAKPKPAAPKDAKPKGDAGKKGGTR